VNVDERINSNLDVPEANTISVDELGGSLVVAGRPATHQVGGRDSILMVGGQYLFFLKYIRSGKFYNPIKTWDLTKGTAKAMAEDDLARARAGTSQYQGMPAKAFLPIVRNLKAELKPE
jgi:hypothetical protein